LQVFAQVFNRRWACGKLRMAVNATVKTLFELSDALPKRIVVSLQNPQRVLAWRHRVFARVL
jgi:hypothetical protein